MTKKWTKKQNRNLAVNVAFISPIFLLYTLFFTVPVILNFSYSFTDWNGLSKKINFVGIKNYIDAFSVDGEFIKAVKFTFIFAFWGFIGVNVVGLGCALIVNLRLRVKNLVRTFIYTPNVISAIVVGFIWKFMYRAVIPEIGNYLGFVFLQQEYLALFRGIVFVVLVPAVWQSSGFA
ncbi:MAG: sugar ABC transporter permease, partial [Treponema sp.]|nr:sugar ABC transporter permease [Treponema sp.]